MTNEFDKEKKDEHKGNDVSYKERAEAATATIDAEKMEQALEQKAKEVQEATDRYLRTYADFENYRKRIRRDIAEFKRYAHEEMGLEILTAVDNLGLALKQSPNHAVRQGVELVHKQILDILARFGIKPFSSEGERFDPAKHDAVLQEVRDDLPENTVVRVLQDGYLYHDKVLRHAKVSVSKKPQKEAGQETTDESSNPLDEM